MQEKRGKWTFARSCAWMSEAAPTEPWKLIPLLYCSATLDKSHRNGNCFTCQLIALGSMFFCSVGYMSRAERWAKGKPIPPIAEIPYFSVSDDEKWSYRLPFRSVLQSLLLPFFCWDALVTLCFTNAHSKFCHMRTNCNTAPHLLIGLRAAN